MGKNKKKWVRISTKKYLACSFLCKTFLIIFTQSVVFGKTLRKKPFWQVGQFADEKSPEDIFWHNIK